MPNLSGFLLILIATMFARAQPACPTILLEAPSEMVQVDQSVPFRVHLKGLGGIPRTARYVWATSLGTITGAFDDPRAALVVPRRDNGTNVTVFVRIEGLPKECPNTASETVAVASLPIGDPLDRFGRLPLADVMARIQGMMPGLKEDPGTTALIDLYFAPDETRPKRLARIDAIRAAIRFNKLDPEKLEFALIEAKEPTFSQTVLWLVPHGAYRKWIEEDRPGAVFVKGVDVMRNPEKALPRRTCDCKWR